VLRVLTAELLPQPRGFEGFLPPEIASVRDDHPVTHLHHPGARLRACRAALRPPYANPPKREYRFAKIDELIDLVAKLVEDFRREPEKGPYPFVASICPRHKRIGVDYKNHIGVDFVPGRLTGLVPVIDEPLGRLHVRHRVAQYPAQGGRSLRYETQQKDRRVVIARACQIKEVTTPDEH
jgi:hypothetical protein